MNSATAKKISFLQQYLRENSDSLHKLDPGNITSFYIGKKQQGNRAGRNYAIIFTVVKKKDEEKLKKAQIIPTHIEVDFPDGIRRKIPTDVRAAGKPKFHLAECIKPLRNGKLDVGTIGVFVADRNNDIFGVTNYHVAGWDRMLAGKYYFNASDDDIFIDRYRSIFIEGIFSNELDVAFIIPSENVTPSNILPGETGIIMDRVFPGPFTPRSIGKQVFVFSLRSPQSRETFIEDNDSPLYTGFKGLKIEGLLRLHPAVTEKGDSGSPVMYGNNLVGLVVAGDNAYTYVVPFYKIQEFKPVALLKP